MPVPHPGASQNVLWVLSYDVESLVSQARLHCSNDLYASLRFFGHYSTQAQFPFSRSGAPRPHVLDVPPTIGTHPSDHSIVSTSRRLGYGADAALLQTLSRSEKVLGRCRSTRSRHVHKYNAFSLSKACLISYPQQRGLWLMYGAIFLLTLRSQSGIGV